ncbi:MAG: hypothetical protein AAB552_03095 [Patescibacteria group bacterium]|mgnify:CR=1 FL=1
MNILNLLTQKKNVVGIEISDSLIRIAFFRAPKKLSHKKNKEKNLAPHDELILVEEPIPSNIIADGVVIDKDLLAKTLQLLRTKIKIDTNYAIVSIPDNKIYSRIFSFPKSVGDTRIPEAMRLAISLQLPIKTESAYLDWERVFDTHGTNEILLSTIDRTVAQGYVEALDKAGWKMVALESHLASIARSIKLPPNQTTLLTEKFPDGTTVFSVKNGSLRFARTLPLASVPEERVAREVRNIKSFLESDSKTPIIEQAIMEAHIRDDYAEHPALTAPKAKWLIPLGALIRGQIPEGRDNLISLLPVGTEEAYAYQKASIFMVLFRNITIGVSIFFMVAYLGAYLFVLFLSQNAVKTISTLSSYSVPPELIQKEAMITHTNGMTQAGEAILKETPVWSGVIEEVLSRVTENIIISTFSTGTVGDKMSVVGVSGNRDSLNRFKKSLQASPMFADVELPLTNLEQKTNIPFSVAFRLKDPSAVYYK